MMKDPFTIPLRCRQRNAIAARRDAFWLTVCRTHHRDGAVIPERGANRESQDPPMRNCTSEICCCGPSRNDLSR